MQREIESYVIENWASLSGGGRKPEKISSLMISQSHGRDFDKGKLTQLIFADGGEYPAIAAKYCKSASYENSLEREAALLKNLEGKNPAPGIARFLAMPEISGRKVLITEGVHGRPVAVLAREASARLGYGLDAMQAEVGKHFELAAEYLAGLKAAAKGEPAVIDEAMVREYVLPVAKDYIEAFDLMGQEKYYCLGAAEGFESQFGGRAVSTVIHCDFVPSNLFWDKETGKAATIDWEFVSEGPLSFLDPFRFIYYYFQEMTSGLPSEGEEDGRFRDAFLGQGNWYFDRAKDFASACLEGMVLTPERFRMLMALFLMYDYRLQTKMSGMVPLQVSMPMRRRVNLLTGFDVTGTLMDALARTNDELSETKTRLLNLEQKAAALSEEAEKAGRMYQSFPWRLYSRIVRAAKGL